VRHAFPYGDNNFPYGEYHIVISGPYGGNYFDMANIACGGRERMAEID